MRLLIAVPPYRIPQVRAAAPAGCAPIMVSNLADTYAAIRSQSVDVAVIDPLLDQPVDGPLLLRTVRSHSSARWLVYTQLRPDMARLLLDLGSAGVRHVVFAGIDDAPGRLSTVLRELVQDSVTQRAVARIMTLLAPLPHQLRVAVEQSILDDRARLDVADLAARACMTRRTLERHFLRAGLPTPKTILLAVRVLSAYRLLYDGTMSCNGVAKTLGYGKVSTLRTHLKRMFGVRARALQAAPTPEIAVSALLGRSVAHSARSYDARDHDRSTAARRKPRRAMGTSKVIG